MKVTVIIENRSYREDLIGQYGLSLLAESGGHTVLLDAGSDGSALENFLTMGLDPARIDAIAVSHNHFDHFGGMPFFLDRCAAPIYISRAARRAYYTKSLFRRRQLVSRTDIIDAYADRFVFVEDQTELFEGVWLCRVGGPDPYFQCRDKRLRQAAEGRLIGDDFSHEIYMAVIEEGACKILSSCSHNGIVNIVNDAGRRFPGSPVTAFVGGLHMRGRRSDTLNCSMAFVDSTVKALEESGLHQIYTGHCTGEKAYSLLKQTRRVEWHYFSSGDVFTV